MNSKKVYEDALVEGSILKFVDQGEKRFQFIRNGYYVVDQQLTTKEQLVMNQIVSLKSNF